MLRVQSFKVFRFESLWAPTMVIIIMVLATSRNSIPLNLACQTPNAERSGS